MIFFSFLLLSFQSFAQSNYSVLGGAVLDPQGRPLAGAAVQITSVSTRTERRVNTNEQGMFQVPALLPGEYELTVQASGFATLTRTLQLEVGQQVSLDLTLSVAGAKDVVEVAGQVPVLHTTDAAIGEVVEPASIKELPLNGRMLIDLVLTVPGAHESHGAQSGRHESAVLAPRPAVSGEHWREPPQCELLPS